MESLGRGFGCSRLGVTRRIGYSRGQNPLIARILIGVAFVFIILSCQEENDYEVQNKESAILQYLVEPPPQTDLSCQQYYTAKSLCLSQTSDPEMHTTPQALASYSLFLSSRESLLFTDITQACHRLYNVPPLVDFSEKTRSCYLRCQAKVWTDLNARGECSGRFRTLYHVEVEISRARNCLQECTKVTNTTEI